VHSLAARIYNELSMVLDLVELPQGRARRRPTSAERQFPTAAISSFSESDPAQEAVLRLSSGRERQPTQGDGYQSSRVGHSLEAMRHVPGKKQQLPSLQVYGGIAELHV